MRGFTYIGRMGLIAALLAMGCSKLDRAPESGALAAAPGLKSKQEVADRAFNTESYDKIDENAFASVAQHPLSTFSIDVDTASYSNVRRFLNEGQLPPEDAVRIEELVNYFPYDYASPQGDEPFALHSELGAAPWNRAHRLLHLGVQTKRALQGKLPRRNLVFLVDVSGSMADENKLPLLKRGLMALSETMSEKDRVSIVVYAGSSGLVLPATRGNDSRSISAALERLSAGGSTNGGDGIQLAYRVAGEQFDAAGINRVVLATDGDFNVGVSSEGELVRLIEKERQSGVYLTVLGFGMGNYKDSTLEKLADRGNGNYAYIDSLPEARKVLVEQGGSTLVTVAEDVKIQIEFNPAEVSGYRLIGYENRVLRAEDFNDDKKDAGEVGAGHSVTALYEIIPAGQAVPSSAVDPLKYQKPAEAKPGNTSRELATLKIRYKAPRGLDSRLLTFPVAGVERDLGATSESFRFSAAVAGFGMLLRRSPHRADASYALVRDLAQGALGSDTHGYRREFLSLVTSAERLSGGKGAQVAR